MIEVDELSAIRKTVSLADIKGRVQLFYRVFDVQPDCKMEGLERAAKTSVALDRLVERYHLGSLAYYYKERASAIMKTRSVPSYWAIPYSRQTTFRSPVNMRSKTHRR